LTERCIAQREDQKMTT